MDSALLGVVLGGLIGVSAQVIAARFARQQQWADARREVYSHYLEQISVGRRRLQEEVERRMHGQPEGMPIKKMASEWYVPGSLPKPFGAWSMTFCNCSRESTKILMSSLSNLNFAGKAS